MDVAGATTIPSQAPAWRPRWSPPAALRDIATVFAERMLMRTALAVAAGVLLAWLAPFGTGRVEAFARAGYWIGVFAIWGLLCTVTRTAVDQLSAIRAPATLQAAAVFVLAIAPMMSIVLVATRALMHWRPDLLEMVELFLQVAVLGGVFDALAQAMAHGRTLGRGLPALPQPRAAEADAQAPDAPAATPNIPSAACRLARRLPLHLRGAILCLQMEDHYVRVHTARGSALLLMRLTDAIEELDGLEGLRVHRSWWVATRACVDVRRTGRTTHITLVSGLAVPVSRPYLDDVTGLPARSRRPAA